MSDFTRRMWDFVVGDRGPLPEVEEQDSEQAWSLWDEAVSESDAQRHLRMASVRERGTAHLRTRDADAARGLAAGAA